MKSIITVRIYRCTMVTKGGETKIKNRRIEIKSTKCLYRQFWVTKYSVSWWSTTIAAGGKIVNEKTLNSRYFSQNI